MKLQLKSKFYISFCSKIENNEVVVYNSIKSKSKILIESVFDSLSKNKNYIKLSDDDFMLQDLSIFRDYDFEIDIIIII